MGTVCVASCFGTLCHQVIEISLKFGLENSSVEWKEVSDRRVPVKDGVQDE